MTMMIRTAALLLAATIMGCAQPDGGDADAEAPVALDSAEQRLSYGIGYNLGNRMRADGVPVDTAAFTAGARDGLSGTEPLLSEAEIAQEMQDYQQQQTAEMEAEMSAASTANSEEGAAFLASNAEEEGVVVLDSGLQYKVLAEGEGESPGPEDTVEVHYRGTLLDGTEFDSSYARNSTVTFGVNQVIPGWTEALQLMSEGSRWMLYIPPELAYGAGGAGGVIGPNATLVFEVELIDVVPGG